MKKLLIIFFLMIFVISSFVSCSSEPQIVELPAMYASYASFEEAFYSADLVVYGEVKELKASHFPSWDVNKWFCKTPIVLNVLDVIKGEGIGETITYESMGGVIGNTKYVSDAYPTDDIKVGSKILVFLLIDDRDGAYTCISPTTTFLEDENGKILVSVSLLPASYSENAEKGSGTLLSVDVDSDEVIGLIKEEYKLWEAKNAPAED
ncbi:MAG: hypothetical protein E7564_03480 [Ruminococcaceae bacterium]|nr:hypothetical protein [Oscillospiraceae bacterium]